MNSATHHPLLPAACRRAGVVPGAGMVGFDSGVGLGLLVVVVNANRPAGRIHHSSCAAGMAGGLFKQFIAAH